MNRRQMGNEGGGLAGAGETPALPGSWSVGSSEWNRRLSMNRGREPRNTPNTRKKAEAADGARGGCLSLESATARRQTRS